MPGEVAGVVYTCLVHPGVSSDKPGRCTYQIEQKHRCAKCSIPNPLAEAGPDGLIHKGGCGGAIVTTPVRCGRTLQAVIVTVGKE